ncbi:LuxR C-terminal-related transcriptional regulator [Winogradskya humida]|nr:response regulator transcription factor [Actinoplanes humidus]
MGESDVRVLVIDGVRLRRDLLVTALRRESVVAEGTGDAEQAARLVAEDGFEVVLLGTGSLPVCRRVVAADDRVQVIAFGLAGNDDEVMDCAEAGVTGYLLHDQPFDALLATITAAAKGEITCPPAIAAALLRGMGRRGAGVREQASRMTPREREVLVLLEAGLSNKEIARRLSIEIRTVKNHVHNLMEKLNVRRRGEAAALMLSQRFALDLSTGA